MPGNIPHLLQVHVIFEADTALPKDRAINTFHFDPGTDVAATGAQLDAIQAALTSFYVTPHTGSATALAAFTSSDRSGIWEMKFYDLEDATPRTPVRDVFPAVFTPGTSAMPAEVALCLSYQAAKFSGFAQRNRRGRLYFGPLSTNTLSSSTGLPVMSADGVADTLAAAGTYLAGASWATGAGERWVVWSPTTAAGAEVTDGWVDNAFDIQRRRGSSPSVRQTWT